MWGVFQCLNIRAATAAAGNSEAWCTTGIGCARMGGRVFRVTVASTDRVPNVIEQLALQSNLTADCITCEWHLETPAARKLGIFGC